MKVTLRSRSASNLAFYIWYKACRLFFVQLYFYFFPVFIVILSLYIPLLLQEQFKIDPPEEFSDPYGVDAYEYESYDWTDFCAAYGDYFPEYCSGDSQYAGEYGLDDYGGGYDEYGGGGEYGGGY